MIKTLPFVGVISGHTDAKKLEGILSDMHRANVERYAATFKDKGFRGFEVTFTRAEYKELQVILNKCDYKAACAYVERHPTFKEI